MASSETIDQSLASAWRHVRSNRLPEAEHIYRDILALQPLHPKALHLLGAVRLELGDAATAVEWIEKSLALAPDNAFGYYHLGMARAILGHLEQAVADYERSVELQPSFPEAHNNLGLVLQQLGRLEAAIARYRKALDVRPNYPKAYNNLGTALLAQGRPEAAIGAFEQALHLDPALVDAQANLGDALLRLGKTDEAITVLERAVELDPRSPVLHKHLGRALLAQGRRAESVAAYERALARDPHDIETCIRLGDAFRESQRLQEALAILDRAVKIAPERPDTYNGLGNVLLALGRYEDCIAAYRRALGRDPEAVETLNNLSNALREAERFDEATSAVQGALKIRPDHANSHNSLGNVLFARGRVEESIAAYRKALELDSAMPEAHLNLGIALKEKGELGNARAALEKALALKPDHAGALAFLFELAQLTCDWARMQALSSAVDAHTRAELAADKKSAETPLNSLRRCDDPALNLAVARCWSNELATRMNRLHGHTHFDHGSNRLRHHRIRVGYVSADFRDHPVGHLIRGLFRRHDRNRFEVFAYSIKDDRGDYRRRIAQDCEHFVDLEDLGPIDAAKVIHDDRIDLLIDLNGYTKHHRMAIFALRPAPVQISYLGFPGSSGADFLDYIISDRILTPPDQAPYYSERFVYMPGCYQVNDADQAASAKRFRRADFGLPDHATVFCSFNNSYKIEPVVFDAWMNILREVEGSVLWLWRSNTPAEDNLRREAGSREVDPDRLIFSSGLPLAEHLVRLGLADLALDTRIYNGGATTSNCLRAGVPVITVAGRHYASRMTASLLNAVRMPELITADLDAYETLAIRLARSPDRLRALKTRLHGNLQRTPLFDTGAFVRDLEAAYTSIWERFLRGETPRLIELPRSSG